MTRLIVAVDEPRGAQLASDLRRADADVVAVWGAGRLLAELRRPHGPGDAVQSALREADAVVLPGDARSLVGEVVAACDRAGVRIVALCRTVGDERGAAAFGLAAVSDDADAWAIVEAAERGSVDEGSPSASPHAAPRSRVIAVWGPAGAPGRSTVAVELAVELARDRRRVALVDADTHAPSIALTLGIADEGPGFAAACRQAERGELDAAELDRISVPVRVGADRIDVLPGINRSSRWPELSARRVAGALTVCRAWAHHTVVDVAAPLERDEEIVSDLIDGPRRNAATLAALQAADVVVAVVAADPLGVARFLRAHAELRGVVGSTPIAVVANRLRPGALGLDARGQVRRTLERFAGVRDVWFVPQDPRSTDAALLAAQPIAAISPRSPLTVGVRRFAREALALPAEPPRPTGERRRSARVVRRVPTALPPAL